MVQNTLDKFSKSLPSIVTMAKKSVDEDSFFIYLRELANDIISSSDKETMVKNAKLVKEMLSYESTNIYELSREESIHLEPFLLLWRFLKNEESPQGVSDDLYQDLYNILCRMTGVIENLPYSSYMFKKHMRRWPSGLDKEIREKRAIRKERIIELLVDKIDKRTALTSSRYQFTPFMTEKEKREQVREWWDDFRFHLAMAIKSPAELNLFMEESLSTKTMKILNRAKKKRIPFFVTPYYISLLCPDINGFDDITIRTYVLYTQSLVDTYGNIKAWEREDIVVSGEPNAAGWLLPDGGNIHRRYPEVAIMIPDTRGRSCGGLCASCQRMYDFQSEHLNFDLEALKPQDSWNKKLVRLMNYFENDSQLRDILITGGDALMSRNKVLERILEAVITMASKKREANKARAEGEKHYEIQRIRLGSRLLAYLPMRIDSQLIEILKEYRERGMKVGIEQFIIQTHFQSPLEVTVEAQKGIEAILSTGWTIYNQLVFTASASRRGHTAKLREVLNSLGVVSYYTFTVKGFEENLEMFAPNSRSMQEQMEEKKFGKMSPRQIEELNNLFENNGDIASSLRRFMKENNLPFLPTDRNVLNLPAVGKSMTFRMVGISKEGKRVLKFGHDHTREHSPVIDKMGEVFIIENRSIASYLREIESIGEKIEEYSSIWDYTWGSTEPLFPLFNYPEPNFTPTKEITNYQE